MSNKTKQLIIAALMYSINPIIAVSTELASINNELKNILSSLPSASNQEDSNRLHNTLIDKLREYQNKATEVADKYENEGSRAESLKYKACALRAASEIARIEVVLAEAKAASELVSINEAINDIRSSLPSASNQEDRNRLHNTLIDKCREYKEKVTEIADKYENEGSPANSLTYAAYARLAAAEIAQLQVMLAKENNTHTETDLKALLEDLSEKYKVAAEALQSAADCASDKETKAGLLNHVGNVFNLAANYAPSKEKCKLLYKAGKAFMSASDNASDEATGTQLLDKAAEAFELAAVYNFIFSISQYLENQ